MFGSFCFKMQLIKLYKKWMVSYGLNKEKDYLLVILIVIAFQIFNSKQIKILLLQMTLNYLKNESMKKKENFSLNADKNNVYIYISIFPS